MSRAPVPSAPPDLVLHGGQVLTVDRAFSCAQALAVRGDRIVAVGDDATVLALAGPRTVRVDLRGRTVLPGFVDAHAHMDREGLRDLVPSLDHARSIADVQAVVRREAARARPGEWIVLGPIGQPPYYLDPPSTLAEHRYPDRRDLDAAAPANPVYIRAPWGYWSDRPPFVAIANTLALRLAGVDRDTAPPCSSVEIERDAAGEPTGRLLERYPITVLELTLMRAVPRFTPELRLRALRESQRLYLAAGVTGIYEGHGVAPEVLDLYRHLHERGELWVRSYLALGGAWAGAATAARAFAAWEPLAGGAGAGDAWLRIGGVFLAPERAAPVADALCAALPYTGWAGFVEDHYSLDQYRALALLAARHNLRVSTIVSGGAAPILDVWEAVDREVPLAGRRWVMVHGRVLPPDLLPRIRRLGAVVTTVPSIHIYRDGRRVVERGVGPDHLLPHRALDDAGIAWALSTDNNPYPMLRTIWQAVARVEHETGQVVGPGQRLTRAQALRAATWAGAYCCFAEGERGSLEPGKLADLVVL
ncbi:MAG TPA: amidohydrolase, partial [Chloroflexota bacterium]|nr:amidohydrolase [Chloroflexota bacterium]